MANQRLRSADETQAAFANEKRVGRNEQLGPMESVMNTVLGGLLPGYFGEETVDLSQ